MNERELLDALLQTANIKELEAAITAYTIANPGAEYVPVGRRPNNRGSIEVASDPGRSAIERITNAHDALLELEHRLHSGKPDCRSPREAAAAWLQVPEREGLSGLTPKQRRDLAVKTIVRMEEGEGTQSRLLSVIDQGIGIAPDQMEGTILSLNESNKIQKHYLAGTYGQGGSSTFAFCKYAVIVSRQYGSDRIGFTVVTYEDLPAEEFKTGRYVFLTLDNRPLEAAAAQEDLRHGTIICHFGYDLTKYSQALGPKSVYGILGRILFDPVCPIRLENQVHKWNRTIKGARNALNGAVDEGDDDDTRGPTLDHHVPMFSVSLGDHGSIGIEYWVLARNEKSKKKPADSFVDSAKPIILTHNGQNQGEITARTIKDDADLPYLHTQGRIICHVNCDALSPNAKRRLFSSTREQSREGYMLERIRQELIESLKADDELGRLNEEAREHSLKEKDETADRRMRKQVAKLLRVAGAALQDVGGAKNEPGGGREVKPRPVPPKPQPITPNEPPTYIKVVWEPEKAMPFYGGQRRYVRIETDANSDYHDSTNPSRSRINVAVGSDLKVFGTSPLKGGRMRIGVECNESVALGSTGSIRVELYRQGLSTLSDEREYKIVQQPEPKRQERKSTLPDFKVTPVSGPEDENWEFICDNPDDTDVSRYASKFIQNEGTLYIYYSEAYPRYATEQRRFAQKSEALASSFKNRYELWLAVHSLLMYQESEDSDDDSDLSEAAVADLERKERSRLAVIAAMVAAQEVTSGVALEDDEEAA